MGARYTRIRAQVVKEMLSIFRDPKSRFILLGPPLMQLFIFSFAMTLEVSNIDVALLNRDSGAASVEFIQQLEASDLVRRTHRVANEKELARLIDTQQVIAGIVIADNFSSKVASGEGGELQVILDGRKANTSQITLGYLQTIAGNVSATIQSHGSRGASDPAAVRHWFNPNLTYRWFVVPSLTGILVMLMALMVTALSIARERELGTFDQLLVSPCTPTEIIIAKTIPAFLVGLALGCVMMAAAIFLFGVPFTGSLWLLLVCMMLFILSVVGIGLMISSVCSTQQQAILGIFAIVVPVVIMSGFATPIENMPKVLQWIAEAIPLKHFLIILQGSFLKSLPPQQVFANAWPLAVIALVTLTLATRMVRSKLQ